MQKFTFKSGLTPYVMGFYKGKSYKQVSIDLYTSSGDDCKLVLTTPYRTLKSIIVQKDKYNDLWNIDYSNDNEVYATCFNMFCCETMFNS